ncbi:MAG: GWxTD domain-containing protein [Gemmatimonadetes bacterium]|nr:GWxTD domain-containing protein [Gemmatimonadota bacterium]
MKHTFFILITLMAAGVSSAGTIDARRDSLYRETLAKVGKVPPEASIEAFERVLKFNWKFAPAHHEIAKRYIELNTPLTRQSARKALDEAMRLDPANGDYQVTLGELLTRQGFSWHAVRHYEKLLQAEPNNAEAAYWSGYYAFKDYLRYRDSDIWGLDAARDLERAEIRIRQSVDADPIYRDAYRLLGLLHVESGYPQALISDYKRLLEQSPEDKDALLYIGLGYQALGDLDKAHGFYARALAGMSDEERKIMENVELVASEEDRIRMMHAIDYDEMSTNWTNDGRDRFWRSLDPLFLTELNERKIEHYGRFAYANLRFSRPFKEISGWQTDPGKTIIKFGPHLKQHIFPSSSGIWKNVWLYEGFRISFQNNDGSDRWRFALGSGHSGGSARSLRERVTVDEEDGGIFHISRLRNDLGDFYAGRNRRNLRATPQPPSRHVFRDTPQRYIDPYRELKYRMPYQVSAFQERDSIRVEFAYAIPKARVQVSRTDGLLDLEDGVFLFDEHWDQVYRRKLDVEMQWPVFDKASETKSDSLRRSHIASFRTLRVSPRQHRLVVEVRDRSTGSIGTFREFREFRTVDSLLAMSDLLLASRIQPKNPFPEGREDLLVTPNPLHTYGRSEPVFIYLEIYNLKEDRFGGTKYRISYRLTRPDREEIRPERFAALDMPGAGAAVEIQTVVAESIIESEEDLWRGDDEASVRFRVKYILPERNRISEELEETPRKKEGAETTVTAQYRGNQEDDFTFLQIDATNAPAGFHKLIVTVKDLYNGQTAERDVVFRVVE